MSACVSPRWNTAETVRPRQRRDLAPQVADVLRRAAVDARAAERDLAEDALAQHPERRRHLRRRVLRVGHAFGRVLRFHARLQLVDGRVAFELPLREVALAELGTDLLVQLAGEFVLARCRRQLLRATTCLLAKLVDAVDDDRALLVRFEDRVADLLFGNLAGESFDHADRIARRRHDEVEVALLHVGVGRQHDDLPVDATEPYRGERLEERDLRDVQCRARADHGEHVGIVLLVGGEDGRVDLHFVEVIGGEERTGGAIDHARGERFLRARPRLALDEAAGELAGRVGSFAVLDLEREEVPTRDDPSGHRRAEHDRLAAANDDRAMSLLGEFSGFESDDLTADRDFYRCLSYRHGCDPFWMFGKSVRRAADVSKRRVVGVGPLFRCERTRRTGRRKEWREGNRKRPRLYFRRPSLPMTAR